MKPLNPVGLIAFDTKKIILDAIRRVVSDPRLKRVDFHFNRDILRIPDIRATSLSETNFIRKIRVLVSFGGDGTFLSAARLVARHSIPLVGVNMGGLGFLTDVPAESAGDELFRILNGEHRLEERMMFDVCLKRKGRLVLSDICLNDVVIKGSRLFDLSVSQGSRPLSSYHADGLIVSTPTGSTAYSMAAGGPIVHPTLECVIITPLCSHSLTQKPIVSAVKNPVVLTIRERRARMSLTIDGKKTFACRDQDEIIVSRSRRVTVILKPRRADFFENLREKLNWGQPR